MPANSFEEAFKVLQLSPGATLSEVERQYYALVQVNEAKERKRVILAFNTLKLLLTPYDQLDTTEQHKLLGILNMMPDTKLSSILKLYPHSGAQFFLDCRNYQNLLCFISKTKIMHTVSSVTSFFSSVTKAWQEPEYLDESYQNPEEDNKPL